MLKSRRLRGLLALLAVSIVALVALPAVPAAADHAPPAESHDAAGSGDFEGSELIEEQDGFPCFRVTRHLFGLRGKGTYEGRTAAGDPVVFRGDMNDSQPLWRDGPLRLQIENTEVYYHSPFGTHGTETSGGAGCSTATTGRPVPAEFRIFAAEGATDTDGDSDVDVLTGEAWIYRLDGTGQKVPCKAEGTYARGAPGGTKFGDPQWKAEWTLAEDCTVVGNAAGTPGTGTAPRGTFHTHHGVHGPCFDGVPNCTSNFRLPFAQYIPKPGPFLILSGPASAVSNCNGGQVTVTARLTVTGWPTPDVPVTFSVAGPRPTAPAVGAGVTGSDGRTSFTFAASQPGDYTVTAEATHGGVARRATHTVGFVERPPIMVTITGPPTAQNNGAVTTRAKVSTGCGNPLGNSNVHFSVMPADPPPPPWRVPGTPTPASGDVTAKPNGEASFTFSGDRAGDYHVTATSSLPTGEQASATHTVRYDIQTMQRKEAIDLPAEEYRLNAAVRDPAGRFAYFATLPGRVIKVDLATFQRVGSIRLFNPDGLPASLLESAVIDPTGRYAYFGTNTSDRRGAVHKVDLQSPEDPSGLKHVGTIVLGPREENLYSAVMDPAGDFAYFTTAGIAEDNFTPLGRVVKVDLRSFTRVGTVSIDSEIGRPLSAVIDPLGRYAYVGMSDVFGSIVKVDLANLQVADSLVLPTGENDPAQAVIDPAGAFAYFGAALSSPGRIVKIDLRTFERVGGIELQERLRTEEMAAIDPAGEFAYFGASDRVVKIDLRRFERVGALSFPDRNDWGLRAVVIDPAGEFAYYGTYSGESRDRVVKVTLNRPPNPALDADGDSYATFYGTPLTVPAPGVLDGDSDVDRDPLIAGQASDPAGGTVALNPDGSFTYTPDAGFAGTDTFTYTASDGMDYSPRATVSVNVAGPEGLLGSAFGYYANVSLFGGPPERRGFGQPATAPAAAASPSVGLPAEGSPTISAYDPDGATAQYGPAVVFGGIWPDDVAAGPPSGPLTASTQGTTAGGGSVASSVKVELHPAPVPVRCYGDPAGTANCTAPGGIGPGPLIADEAHSSCTADKSGVRASARFVNGVVETKYDPDTQLPVESQPIPAEPPRGYTVEGTLDHVGDRFRIVFNEQLVSGGGSLVTVNAAHIYLLGPIAVGDLVIGQSVCGSPPAPNTNPDASDDAYNTVAGTALTVGAPGVLGNDADPDGDAISASSASDPAGGSVALNPDGSFTYTPDAGFSGTDTFTYAVADGFGGFDAATVTVIVTPPPTGDTRPTQLSVGDLSVVEGDGPTTATFAITRAGDTTGASTVKYKTGAGTATAGIDYTAVPSLTTLTFGPGETAKRVSVPVAGDSLPEANETFNLVLSSPTGAVLADASGAATVRNDDGAAYLAVESVTVTEANVDTTATFRITRSGNTTGASSVKYKTNVGTAGADDFVAVPLTAVTFGPAETFKDVTVTIRGDSLDEKNETFSLALSAPVGAVVADAAGTATIVDDEGTVVPGPATFFSVDNVLVNEGNTGTTPAVFTVTRTGNTDVPSTVKYKTSGGTATAGGDYTAIATLGTLSFAAGETAKTVTVDVTGDALPEGDEAFNLVLSAPTGAVIADASGTATIVNDDGAAYVAVDNVAVTEGNSGTTQVTFTVSRSGNTTGASTVKVRTSGGTATAGTDYTALPLTAVDFAAGETTKTVTVDILTDTVKEANETVNLALTTPVGATVSDAAGTATIVNDDP